MSAPCLKRLRTPSLEEDAEAVAVAAAACVGGRCACGVEDAYHATFELCHLSDCALRLDSCTASSFIMHFVSMGDIAQYGIHRVLAVVYGGKVEVKPFAKEDEIEMHGRIGKGSVSTGEMHAALGSMFSPSRQYVREDLEAAGLSPLCRCK